MNPSIATYKERIERLDKDPILHWAPALVRDVLSQISSKYDIPLVRVEGLYTLLHPVLDEDGDKCLGLESRVCSPNESMFLYVECWDRNSFTVMRENPDLRIGAVPQKEDNSAQVLEQIKQSLDSVKPLESFSPQRFFPEVIAQYFIGSGYTAEFLGSALDPENPDVLTVVFLPQASDIKQMFAMTYALRYL